MSEVRVIKTLSDERLIINYNELVPGVQYVVIFNNKRVVVEKKKDGRVVITEG